MRSNRPLTWALFAVLSIFLSACQPLSPARAKVGERTIRERDIQQREQILRLYYPQHTGDLKDAALRELKEAAISAEILKSHGRPVTREVLEQEAARIDKASLMPELLEKMKAIFGSDRQSYLDNYVLPVYTGRVLYYEFFLRDSTIQAPSLAVAQAFLLEAVKAGNDFQKAKSTTATGQTPPIEKATLSLARGVEFDPAKNLPSGPPDRTTSKSVDASTSMPPTVQKQIKDRVQEQISEEGKRWVENVIAKLKPGQVFPTVVDHNDRWWVVRYIAPKPKTPDTYLLEIAIFPKREYAPWLEAERRKVPQS